MYVCCCCHPAVLLPPLLLLLLLLLLCTAQGVVPSNAFKDFVKEEVETQVCVMRTLTVTATITGFCA
jgi:hypothetical protein